MKLKIYNYLIDNKVKTDTIGFIYLISLIQLCLEDNSHFKNLTKTYNIIAEECNTSSKSVLRAIQYVIHPTKYKSNIRQLLFDCLFTLKEN